VPTRPQPCDKTHDAAADSAAECDMRNKYIIQEYFAINSFAASETAENVFNLWSKNAHEVFKPLAAPLADERPSRQICRLSASPAVCVLSHLMR
jgi:hypothetical protein